MKKFLLFFSYLFNPLFVPTYATLFYFFVTLNYFHKHEVYLVFVEVLILTLLLPISLFYLFRSLGIVRTKMLLNKRERRLPLAFYAILLFTLIKHSLANLVIPELYYYFLGVLISILTALTLVIFNRKISLHVMGVSSLTLFVISIATYYHTNFLALIGLLILCCGLVASARLQDDEHSLSGVVSGALAGVIPQVLLWFVWLIPVF